MAFVLWRVKPQLDTPSNGVWLGPGARNATAGLWLGALAEVVQGKSPAVWISTAKEQVIGLFGKRGSGKSFTLGAFVEGLVVKSVAPHVAKGDNRRAVLLFDPLDTYWTTKFPVWESPNSEATKHYEMARASHLEGLEFDVDAWIPGEGARRSADPEWFRVLTLAVAEIGIDEWSALLDVNVVSDPIGQALTDAISLVTGPPSTGDPGAPAASGSATYRYGLGDLIDAVEAPDILRNYHPETVRALRQRLASLRATGLFSADGMSVGQMLAAGKVSVILLGRLPQAYRAAVVSVLTRQLIKQRSEVTFAEKRLALDPALSSTARSELEVVVRAGVPKTLVALDEAQSFLAPGTASTVRDVFVQLVKEGRNIGLSAMLATQQPSALDRRILSQVETFITHQLVTEGDISAVRDNLKTALPDGIEFGKLVLSFADLLRMLGPGQCVVSAADMNTTLRRCIVLSVRPRATVHGGIEL